MHIYAVGLASQFSMLTENEFLKAFTARWCRNTNIVHTCYGELDISVWGVFRIICLLIVRQMYEGFFPGNVIIMNQKLSCALVLLFQKWEELSDGEKMSKYILFG